MPLVVDKLKMEIKTRVYNALEKEFSKDTKGNPKAKEYWNKLASAVSEMAEDIVNAMQQDAQVSPGIPVVGGSATGGPVSGTTSSPGKII